MATTLIGADVGGTYARLGWASLREDAPLRVQGFRKYACADYPNLAAILSDYAHWLQAETGGPLVRHAVVAIAGVLDGDTVLNTNLAWPVSLSATRHDAGLETLELINDFVAVAQAVPHVDASSMHCICGDESLSVQTPTVVLGPGTGLGVALRLADRVLPSEGGHGALAPVTALEQQVLKLLSHRYQHVDTERVLSGPGLVALYGCLCELRGVAPLYDTPATLIEAARDGADALAKESIDIFCAWLGSVAGDLALTFGARSVYLTGGITGYIAGALHAGGFQERFVAKGALSPALHRVSVWRVEHGELGVLGALAWHADKIAGIR